MNPYSAPASAVEDPPLPVFPRPPEVTRACRILWIVALAGLLSLHPAIRGQWIDLEDRGTAVFAAVIVLIAISAAIYLGLVLLIGRRRGWARWALLIYVVVSTFPAAIDFPRSMSETPIAALTDLLTTFAELWAFYLVFFGAGADWFRRGHAG